MLILVESESKKRAAQTSLEAQLRRDLPDQGKLMIGLPSGSGPERVYSEGPGKLYWAHHIADDAAVPRHWNAFGFLRPGASMQHITVEINVPIGSQSRRVAGFIARDVETGRLFLMHDGGVGGGKKGIGRAEFLRWAALTLQPVYHHASSDRSGIVVAEIGAPDLVGRLETFAGLVRDFKANAPAPAGASPNEQIIDDGEDWLDKDEFSGRKQGTQKSDLDYISYHGDVVRALRDHREARASADERVGRTTRIDLAVRRAGRLAEVYEVKTSLNRQILYTAIGQLMTHSLTKDGVAKRYLVMPASDEPLPADIARCVQQHDVRLLRFQLLGKKRRSVALLP